MKILILIKVSKGAKIRNRYNQVPHLTQDTNGKVTNSQSDSTNDSQEASLFPAGDHKAHIYRRSQRHSKQKTEKNVNDPQKKYRLRTVSKIFYLRAYQVCKSFCKLSVVDLNCSFVSKNKQIILLGIIEDCE